MLRSFRVANHRSIRDEQELLLIPTYQGGAPAVPVAAVFGANASGKSNLVDALRWMSGAVQRSYRSWEADFGIPRNRYRLDAGGEETPSTFVVDLVVDGVPFVYGFSVTSLVVAEEWLHASPHGRERVIFERHGQRVELGSTVPERRGRAELLAGLLRDNALLLSTAAQAKQEEVLPVYRWFRDGLRFLDAARDPVAVGARVVEGLRRFPGLPDLLKAADLGITDVRVVERTLVVSHSMGGLLARDTVGDLVPAEARRDLTFLHGPRGVPLGVEDQSDGTLAWADLLVAALSALASGALLVTDEIDASLHPRLTARLIDLFRGAGTNPAGAQLLFTTHDASLLGTNLGDELLQRDEIWFVEKEDGASRLYPLSDFHPRKGENRERRYLAGSYGAVPVVFEDSLVTPLLAAKGEPADGAA